MQSIRKENDGLTHLIDHFCDGEAIEREHPVDENEEEEDE